MKEKYDQPKEVPMKRYPGENKPSWPSMVNSITEPPKRSIARGGGAARRGKGFGKNG